jgi:regulator of protease activity HflC (stomatin/prohibitin superfamily)
MSDRVEVVREVLRTLVVEPATRLGRATAAGARALAEASRRARTRLLVLGALAIAGYAIGSHPPLQAVGRGELVVRSNRFTGSTREFNTGILFALPGLHQVRRFETREQVYRPRESANATGESPFQSVEGLSIGVDLTVRYAIDPRRIAQASRELPDDISAEVVRPAVQGVIYKLFARYTVREIFSSKRVEIQQAIENELKPKLAAAGLVLRGVEMGKVDLPADYRRGMDRLLAEELETEKMRFTLELKDKRVKETELDAEADKVRREKAAEASAQEQVIAARAQEEAMKHVLPFKEKQIQQRRLEAEAEKVARIRSAEGAAEARRIEATGEADSRQKLADAEVYRLEKVGQVTSGQMEREGALIQRYPLLIEKTLADKLSDKIQVIIAPPPRDGGFFGATLLGAKGGTSAGTTATPRAGKQGEE